MYHLNINNATYQWSYSNHTYYKCNYVSNSSNKEIVLQPLRDGLGPSHFFISILGKGRLKIPRLAASKISQQQWFVLLNKCGSWWKSPCCATPLWGFVWPGAKQDLLRKQQIIERKSLVKYRQARLIGVISTVTGTKDVSLWIYADYICIHFPHKHLCYETCVFWLETIVSRVPQNIYFDRTKQRFWGNVCWHMKNKPFKKNSFCSLVVLAEQARETPKLLFGWLRGRYGNFAKYCNPHSMQQQKQNGIVFPRECSHEKNKFGIGRRKPNTERKAEKNVSV